MSRFLVTYHGGGMPEGDEARQQAMAAFGAWAAGAGKALIDPGAPLGPPVTVSSDGAAAGPAKGPVAGYSVLEADNVDAAVALLAGHPFVARGGSLQVSPSMAP